MRVNLACPFSEKDEAKSLGARWDPARKTWYVENPDDLQPFARWIRGMGAPTIDQAKKAGQRAVKRAKRVFVTIGKGYTDAPHPDGLLPWEDEDPPELIRLVRDIGYKS